MDVRLTAATRAITRLTMAEARKIRERNQATSLNGLVEDFAFADQIF